MKTAFVAVVAWAVCGSAGAADYILVPRHRSVEWNTVGGYAEFLRLSGKLDAPGRPRDRQAEAGEDAGRASLRQVGRHAARLTAAEIARRAKAAAVKAKLTEDNAARFEAAFVKVFEDARAATASK